MSGRHVIAEAVPRPGKLLRPGRDFELCFNDRLIVVVAWPQHHPVLTERDRLIIVICRNVLDVENRHGRPMLIDTPATSIAGEALSTTCIFRAGYRAYFLHLPGTGVCGIARTDPEVDLPHLLVLLEVARRALERDAPGLQHVGIIRNAKRQRDRLLRQ
jgi:hypothetical protein